MPRRRKNSRRWQMVVVANDFQIPWHDEEALGLFERFLRREWPDWLVLAGDFMDFWEISSFDHTPRTGKAFLEEIMSLPIRFPFPRTVSQG